jgi:four helix bundle protein
MAKRSIVKEKAIAFALEIIDLYRFLTAKREYVMSKQLLRSATSIGANVSEALAGESNRDFLHKMALGTHKNVNSNCEDYLQ